VRNIDCTESTDSVYKCTCPGDDAVEVRASGNGFAGCDGGDDTPAIPDVLDQVTEDELAARAVNEIPEILEVTLLSSTDDTLVFSVQSSVEVSEFENQLKDVIADLVGSRFGRGDVDLEVENVAKRAVFQSTVTATISEPEDAPATAFLRDALAAVVLGLGLSAALL